MGIPWVTIFFMFAYAILPDGKWRNSVLALACIAIVFSLTRLSRGI